MGLFRNLSRWLNGSFSCVRCGRELHIMSFGYGTAICPDCYNGEQHFLFFDDRFWLNRILMRLLYRGLPRTRPPSSDPALDPTLFAQPEVEVVS